MRIVLASLVSIIQQLQDEGLMDVAINDDMLTGELFCTVMLIATRYR